MIRQGSHRALNKGCIGMPRVRAADKLRRVGLRPTRQRVSLGWLLFGKATGTSRPKCSSTKPPGPASRSRWRRSTTPCTSSRTGLLRQFAVDGAKAYFDTNPTEHHHFFLEEEGEIVDMPSSGLSVADLPEPPEGMEVAGVEVIVRLRKTKCVFS